MKGRTSLLTAAQSKEGHIIKNISLALTRTSSHVPKHKQRPGPPRLCSLRLWMMTATESNRQLVVWCNQDLLPQRDMSSAYRSSISNILKCRRFVGKNSLKWWVLALPLAWWCICVGFLAKCCILSAAKVSEVRIEMRSLRRS